MNRDFSVATFDYDPAELSPEVPDFMGHSVGEIPMRVRICGLDMLTANVEDNPADESPWFALNPIDLATYGLFSLRRSMANGRSAIDIDETGEYLLLKSEGLRTIVHSTFTGATVDVSSDELYRDWQAFAQTVKTEVTARHPQLVGHPIWRLWTADINHDRIGWNNVTTIAFTRHEGPNWEATRRC